MVRIVSMLLVVCVHFVPSSVPRQRHLEIRWALLFHGVVIAVLSPHKVWLVHVKKIYQKIYMFLNTSTCLYARNGRISEPGCLSR
jgi:hypothetical protein